MVGKGTGLTIVAEPLSAQAFAPYGTIAALDAAAGSGRPVNQGRARRRSGLHELGHDAAAARAVLDLYDIAASALPFALICFERHPLSAQAFVPCEAARLLVAVAPDNGGRPDLVGARAFIATRTIIHYRAGVWHAPLAALETPARLAMLMWEAGDTRDCEEFFLSKPLVVTSG